MDSNENVVILITKDSFLSFRLSATTGEHYSYDGSLHDNILIVLSSCRCKNCNTPNILIGFDGIEIFDVEPRSMGNESYFRYEAYGQCGNCGKHIQVTFQFTEYQYTFFYIDDEDAENYIPSFVSNLELVAKEIANLYREKYAISEELDLITDPTQPKRYRILVEGRDDKPVLEILLERCGLDPNFDFMVFSGERKGNGFKAVLKIVTLLKRLETDIPFIAFVDSDNNRAEHIQQLKEAGATDHEMLVLKKEEIEDYLIDAQAISTVIGKSEESVRKFINDNRDKYDSKALLNKLFHNFGLSSPKSNIKKEIAEKLLEVPEEIVQLSNRMKIIKNL